MSQLKSVKTIESAEDKLGWIFTAFDEDGGGTMDPEEVAQIVLGLFRFVIVVVDQDGGCIMDLKEIVPCSIRHNVGRLVLVLDVGDDDEKEYVAGRRH